MPRSVIDEAVLNPKASVPVYCVYVPINPSSEYWKYDATLDQVAAGVYVGARRGPIR